MDVKGIYAGSIARPTVTQMHEDEGTLPFSNNFACEDIPQEKSPIITELEAMAITNKQLLESLGVQFKKTELDNGYKKIDRIRLGKVNGYYILDPQDKKVRYANQIDGDKIGTLTFYQQDGTTESAILHNVKPYGDLYKAERALILRENGIYPYNEYENCVLSIPEYDSPEIVPVIQEEVA